VRLELRNIVDDKVRHRGGAAVFPPLDEDLVVAFHSVVFLLLRRHELRKKTEEVDGNFIASFFLLSSLYVGLTE